MLVLIVIQSVVLVVLVVLVAGLLRAYATVLRRLHQLDGGVTPAPTGTQFSLTPARRPAPEREFGDGHDVTGETPTGELVSSRVLGVEHDTLLLFLSSGCQTCQQFWAELRDPDFALPGDTRLLVVPQSAEDESITDLRELAPAGVDVILSSQAWRDYEVPGSPHAVFVDGHTGTVRGEGTGQSLTQVVRLVAQSSGQDTVGNKGPRLTKSARDAAQEAAVDRELTAAGILPGDPRLYQGDQ